MLALATPGLVWGPLRLPRTRGQLALNDRTEAVSWIVIPQRPIGPNVLVWMTRKLSGQASSPNLVVTTDPKLTRNTRAGYC